MIEQHAPLGSKKHFFFLNVDTSPDLDRSGLPRYRPLQESDVDALLDDLGEHLRDELGLTTGPIDKAKRSEVLNAPVTFLYQILQREVAAM